MDRFLAETIICKTCIDELEKLVSFGGARGGPDVARCTVTCFLLSLSLKDPSSGVEGTKILSLQITVRCTYRATR